jgi:hypothetical protein
VFALGLDFGLNIGFHGILALGGNGGGGVRSTFNHSL